MRWVAVAAMAALGAFSCGGQGPSPPSSAESEVLLDSKPPGASILIQGAAVGRTPFALRLRGETNVVLELDGYLRHAVFLQPGGPRRVEVPLISASAAPPPPSATRPAGAETPPAEKKLAEEAGASYTTLRAAREAYRSGRIDRAEYDRTVRRLRARRDEELDAIRRDYRERRISRDEFRRRSRIVEARYEG